MDSPVITVGIPAYNSEIYLAETLRSVLGQTFDQIEVVISDNASTDRTAEICREFAARDSRVRYIRQQKNLGVPGNYNFVLSQARGRYFKWCSSNDICKPRFLEACVRVLEERPDVVLAYPRTRLFDGKRNTCEDYTDNLDLQMDDAIERYIACSVRLDMNNVLNALIRTEHLRRTTLHWDYASSDLMISRELTLYGKFVEVPEWLFYRRAETAAIYGTGSKETFRHYYPKARYGSRFGGWRRLLQSVAGTIRAPLRPFDRLRLWHALLKVTWWRRGELIWWVTSRRAA
jgi:glycosyltransferase involved in cell wall biosynthesis